ncbi:MAG TPA: aminotransferase class IV family protein [Candidatus Saccharimonadia bacterium]|nr:aminotransferase class IV family protein [Candidatus Saccharimonadia bacterium]
MPDSCIEANGGPATLDDVRRIAAFNYGHFTVMQFRDGGVRGLSLHLARLDAASRELFGRPLDPSRVRGYLAHALASRIGPASVRVNVHSRALDREALAVPAEPDVFVSLGAPAPVAHAPVRVRTVQYARELPHVKHVGTFGLFHQRRLAQLAGFDDALFASATGEISEGTIWNVGFHDGAGVVWPDAPALRGITQQLLEGALAARGIAQVRRPVHADELAHFRAAFLVNTASVVQPIASIDATAFDDSVALAAMLRELHDAVAPEPIGP